MLREATQIYESRNFSQAASIIARERMRKLTFYHQKLGVHSWRPWQQGTILGMRER